MTGTITWSETRHGEGELTLIWEDGSREARFSPEPITAATDSHAVASMFGAFDIVEHDGEYIHVTRAEPR